MMGYLAGDSPQPTRFNMWHIGHAEHGWMAKLEFEYITVHGSAPTGNNAAALRAAFCKEYLDKHEDPDVVQALQEEYEQYKSDLALLHKSISTLSQEDAPGDKLSFEDWHMYIHQLIEFTSLDS
jgi:hypothetical protein